MADEGGMGKTLSSVVVALNYLHEYGGAVIVLCPPLQTKQWFDAFKGCGVQVRRRGAACLSNGTLSDGVTIISKYSPMSNPISPNANLHERVQLCILDEGHEGMIASSSNFSAPLANSIQAVLLQCRRRLIATATPIRKDWGELVALMQAVCKNQDDVNRLGQFQNTASWVGRVRDEWLPALNRLHDGQISQQDAQMLGSMVGDMCPLLSTNEANILSQTLPSHSLQASKGPPEIRARLARDLHPFGKYMSIALRDDLGQDRVHSLYRKRSTRVKTFADWQELSGCIEASKKYIRKNATILRSCPLNALDERYSKSFDPLIRDDQAAKASLEQAWREDPRLDILKEICSDSKDNHQPGKRAGVVVFCEWRGTISLLREWAEKEGMDAFSLQGLDANQQQSLSRGAAKDHRILQMQTLRNARKGAIESNRTTILICGPGATVGLDMEWATHAVHWDVSYGTVENVAQKTWRLDRRWDGAPDVTQEFHVTFLVNEEDLQRTVDANLAYRDNRTLLGDRRYLQGGPSPPLFPDPDQFHPDSWSASSRDISLSSPRATWTWDWVNGSATDLSGTAEALNLHSLRSSVGLELDLVDPVRGIDTDAEGDVGLSRSQIHDLIRISSPEERGSLQFLAGGCSVGREVSTRFGPPGSLLPTLGILPDGKLSNTISEYLRGAWEEDDPYPFVGFRSDLEKPYRLAVHLGVLDALSGEAGQLIRRLWAEECPTGLIVSTDGGEWEHVLLGGIEDFEDDADLMLELGSENQFPCDPPDISVTSDRNRFLSMEPLRSTLDWTALSARLGRRFPARVPRAGLLPLVQYLKRMPVRDPATDFLPIALFFNEPQDNFNGDGMPCYVCKTDACSHCDCVDGRSIPWDADFLDVGWC